MYAILKNFSNKWVKLLLKEVSKDYLMGKSKMPLKWGYHCTIEPIFGVQFN